MPEALARDSAEKRAPSDAQLAALDAYWRAANYLTIGQIYLRDNPRRAVHRPDVVLVRGHDRVDESRREEALRGEELLGSSRRVRSQRRRRMMCG